MHQNKSIGENYAYNLVNQAITFLVPLILIPYTSRILGADNIGIYSYCFSIVTIFSSMGKLGLNTYGQLIIAEKRDDDTVLKKISSELFAVRTILISITLCAYLAFGLVIGTYKRVFILMSIYYISDVFDVTWLFYGLENFKSVARRNLLTKALNLLLVLIFVRSQDDFYAYIVIMQICSCASNIVLFINVREIITLRLLPINVFTNHIKNCGVYFIPTIANTVYNIMDKSMLGALGKSTYQSGCYEQAYKIISVSQYALLAIGTTTLPRLAFLFSTDNKEEAKSIIKKSMELISLLLYPIIVGLFLEAPIIVRVVLGEGYDDSINVLRILSVLVFFAVFNYNIGNQVLVSQKLQKKYNIGVCLGAAVNFIMNITLIPVFKANGAAIASLIAEIVIFIQFVYFSRDIIQIKNIISQKAFKYLIVSLFMGAVIKMLNTYIITKDTIVDLIITIIISVFVYFGFLFVSKDGNIMMLLKKIKR